MTDTPVDVGDLAPPFTLPDADGRPVSLADHAGHPVLVYFYPAALTPGCTTQACDFTSARGDLDSAGYQVIGISPDTPEKLAEFRATENLGITLLADPGKDVLRAYGAFGEKNNYGRIVQGVLRSTFLVGADGRIEKVWRNVKATGHVARLLKELGVAG
ncbi:thioredoxin-dependent thiol peroxidase [Nakamurella flavida]|uniref:thioredoxin-dependent peroxiredoxin n=1 Tax=Nakamurella flavida TaxID=363630 RepID=A0A938YJN8_9ACTN|nr:thioredoxin-dependent thiol peroxidase [Nakamurella flavida]MBM9477217.1 thioredoxin-dependent thiol peroxidase [Nakamurella flavida]MDP9780166.1 peroxiredoxin Q/BCP [Nakamurella flavida]